MRARIHRGAHEVGGGCVELESDGQRLVLDVGLPLSMSADEDATLPAVTGLGSGDPSLLGVVLSHAHPDHYGLVDQVRADVPTMPVGRPAGSCAKRHSSPAEAPIFGLQASSKTSGRFTSGPLSSRLTSSTIPPSTRTPSLSRRAGGDCSTAATSASMGARPGRASGCSDRPQPTCTSSSWKERRSAARRARGSR